MPARRSPVIGYLNSASRDQDSGRLRTFREGLRDAGFLEGRNVAIDNYVAQVDAHPEKHRLTIRLRGFLDFESAPDRLNRASELAQESVAGRLHQSTTSLSHLRLDHLALERLRASASPPHPSPSSTRSPPRRRPGSQRGVGWSFGETSAAERVDEKLLHPAMPKRINR